MRDANLTTGPKQYYDDLDDAVAVVAAAYPGARREGSVGAWSWAIAGEVVAEAWLHATKPVWWVRVRPARRR